MRCRAARAALAACLLLCLAASAHAQDVRYKVLTDENFEHETQAATGQTAGAWLVLLCHHLDFEAMRPHWDDLARHAMEEQVFLGKADLDANPGLRHRFGMHGDSEVLLFRNKKMYLWNGRIHDTGPIFHWARGGYLEDAATPPLEVPPPLTLAQELVRRLLRHISTRVATGVMWTFVIGAIVLMAIRNTAEERAQAPVRANMPQ